MSTNSTTEHIQEDAVQNKSVEPSQGYFKTKIVWFNLLGFLAMHLIGSIGGLYCLFHMKVLTFFWTFLLVFLGGIGITVGAHRLFTHRSYKAVWGFRLFLIILQTLAGQNCLYIWVRDHRQHHKYSDTDADPHNSQRGFFFSHIGWLMMRKHPDVKNTWKHIDLSDLEADPLVMFQKKYYKPLYVIFAMTIPIGVPLLWGETLFNSVVICFFSRYIIQLNGTWLVNSYAHFFGNRPYNKDIRPVEAILVSIIALGEGWHNYHHCFPWDYRTSEYGRFFNPSTYIIDTAARLGWVYGLRTAPLEMIRLRAQKRGDGSHVIWGENAQNSEKLKGGIDVHKDDGYASVGDEIQSGNEKTPSPIIDNGTHHRRRRLVQQG
ncbi:acyl-CoA Delta12-desaturase-like [Anabrus simplex]|uniref:acyl-CoA Delta12-desaturase-like n=1 Tax=Anabrus simplex TaxID=316456 RepID=UPI0035A2F3B3